MENNLNDQEIARRDKLNKYRELKVDPFGSSFKVTHSIEEIRKLTKNKSAEKLQKMKLYVSVAGRIKFLRKMGKASFLNLQDRTGSIQAYIGIDVVGEKNYALFKLADVGDIVGLYGSLMLTRTGELTIRVEKFSHLSKCLHPLPEKFHGLVDVEERSRRRYLDLIMNEDARKVAFSRAKLIRSIQSYMDNLGFVEVETAVLSPILGGASARPFVAHMNALDRDFYLRIATELNLKRLIVGGMEKVYEIGRLFRNEGMDASHNPEFTTIEAYEAYSDLKGMRKLAEGLIKKAAKDVTGSTKVTYQGVEVDFSKPFRFVKMADLIKEATGIDFRNIYEYKEAKNLADSHQIKVEKHQESVGHIMNLFFEKYCEEKLIQPTFVYCYPLEVSPLTKKCKDPRFTERFELFAFGKELANAYSELNDPLDQKERFIAQLKAKELGDAEANEMDVDFIEALEYAMPPTGGIGLGIDRLCMLLTNQENIREVILFPMMKDR